MGNSTSLPEVGVELSYMFNYTLPVNTTTTPTYDAKNYTGHPPSDTQNAATINIGYLCLGLAGPLIALRLLLRLLNHMKYKIDDFIMLFSLLLLGFMTASNPLIV